MKIIIDANRIIAALIKEGITREILFNESFEFIAPEYTISEIKKYQEELIKKSKLGTEEFEIILSLVFENIRIIAKSEYEPIINKYRNCIKDLDDLPYIAVCIATKSIGIWTHDQHLLKQDKVRTFTNIQMLELIQ